MRRISTTQSMGATTGGGASALDRVMLFARIGTWTPTRPRGTCACKLGPDFCMSPVARSVRHAAYVAGPDRVRELGDL